MSFFLRKALWIHLVVAFVPAAGAGSADSSVALDAGSSITVVLANRRVPESEPLARRYMALREIPEKNLCLLDLPPGETMARRVYERDLRDPLLAFLREQGLIEQVKRDQAAIGAHDSGWRTTRTRIRYLVSMYGVPLRIAETRPFLVDKIARLIEEPFQRDVAAVDSELSCLLWESYELKGYVPNPQYNMLFSSRYEKQTHPVLIAARLDGPEASTVERMMDDAVRIEREGLRGLVYIDEQASRDADYRMGDFWMREAAMRMSRLGFDVIYDGNEALFDDYFPMEHAAVYLGWYAEHVTGPFRQSWFQFQPGAVAYHLHSGSAKTLRSPDRHWAGPLLTRGAAAVMGAVEEPYLAYTPDLQIFIDRLASGHTFGESAYLSLRALSWQTTIAGDPLYRPFARIAEASINLPEDVSPDLAAREHARRINLLADKHQLNVAMAYGREALKKTDHPFVHEKMADLYARNNLWSEAITHLEQVVTNTTHDATALRLGRQLSVLYRTIGRTNDAARVDASLRAAWPDSPYLPYLDMRVGP